jgi:hypothetical protein
MNNIFKKIRLDGTSAAASLPLGTFALNSQQNGPSKKHWLSAYYKTHQTKSNQIKP